MFYLIIVGILAAQVVPLWNGVAPGSERKTGSEIIDPVTNPRDSKHLHNIHNPSLTVYLPAADKATGAAMIIAPGAAIVSSRSIPKWTT